MNIKKLSWILIGGVLLAVTAYAGILILVTWPIEEFSIAKSGVFGDSFGLLTSLFSGLAFAGLIITIFMQREELALQREELNLTRQELSGQKEEMKSQNETMRIQRFENTFFKMLELVSTSRDQIHYLHSHSKGSTDIYGREAINRIYDCFINDHLHEFSHHSGYGTPVTKFKSTCDNFDAISSEYTDFYIEHGDSLGQYYRVIFNILKLIDSIDFIADKQVYSNLLRAQFSRFELSLLFYNCLSIYGKDKMAQLVKKYRILKHLEINTLPEQHLPIWEQFQSAT